MPIFRRWLTSPASIGRFKKLAKFLQQAAAQGLLRVSVKQGGVMFVDSVRFAARTAARPGRCFTAIADTNQIDPDHELVKSHEQWPARSTAGWQAEKQRRRQAQAAEAEAEAEAAAGTGGRGAAPGAGESRASRSTGALARGDMP